MKWHAILMLWLLLGSFTVFTWAAFSALLAGLWIYPVVWLVLFPVYVAMVIYFGKVLVSED